MEAGDAGGIVRGQRRPHLIYKGSSEFLACDGGREGTLGGSCGDALCTQGSSCRLTISVPGPQGIPPGPQGIPLGPRPPPLSLAAGDGGTAH